MKLAYQDQLLVDIKTEKAEMVNLNVLDKLADALGVNVSELFTRNHNTHKLEDWIKKSKCIEVE